MFLPNQAQRPAKVNCMPSKLSWTRPAKSLGSLGLALCAGSRERSALVSTVCSWVSHLFANQVMTSTCINKESCAWCCSGRSKHEKRLVRVSGTRKGYDNRQEATTHNALTTMKVGVLAQEPPYKT
jgi:hypothetical protein